MARTAAANAHPNARPLVCSPACSLARGSAGFYNETTQTLYYWHNATAGVPPALPAKPLVTCTPRRDDPCPPAAAPRLRPGVRRPHRRRRRLSVGDVLGRLLRCPRGRAVRVVWRLAPGEGEDGGGGAGGRIGSVGGGGRAMRRPSRPPRPATDAPTPSFPAAPAGAAPVRPPRRLPPRPGPGAGLWQLPAVSPNARNCRVEMAGEGGGRGCYGRRGAATPGRASSNPRPPTLSSLSSIPLQGMTTA